MKYAAVVDIFHYLTSFLGCQVHPGRVRTRSELEPPGPGKDPTDGDHEVTKWL